MGAVEQTSETDDLLSEDVIDSQVSSRERDTAEGSERSLAIWLFMTGAIALASSATLVFERLQIFVDAGHTSVCDINALLNHRYDDSRRHACRSYLQKMVLGSHQHRFSARDSVCLLALV